ncbi:AraC family transcriptional regulator [Pseudomonas sp. MAP12]|uniref:AraC family transcriptional regulator n=1 Tax=Geopseudomonas aromaticivorans TaxID=2849492 RepID=A0ABS6N1W6_9GAMM|nr:AraC family transcriptional regulator [Pseudomonas aromaticivorans]MBV2135044.1 AraC family transcriptional regulator [Pseudomonas aromaticivorans]
MNSSMSPIEWLLESLELDASLFHVGRYCGGWHASTQGLARASFHLLVQGRCWLHVDGQAPQALEAGDALFILRDVPYRLSGEASSAAACAAPRGQMQALELGAEEGVGLVCGFFHFQPGLSELIVDSLPTCLLLRAGDPALSAARSLFELILAECARPQGPSAGVLERLSQLLFLYVLRQHGTTSGELRGLLALARQPAFAALLERLIAAPAETWTLEQMAACVGLSRAAFAKRFHELSGQTPGQVLLGLRMREACRLLKEGQAVAEVAEAVGYQSVAAFTRAFDKVVGLPPGAYRRSNGLGG